MEIKKAKSQQQKLHRTNTILDAAESLFAAGNGELPSAIQIANKAKIAKGTVYLYFSSKEGIFLTLLERHIHKWLQEFDKSIRQYEQPSVEDVCQYLYAYWQSTPQLGQLYRIGDAVLAPNVEDKIYAEFHMRVVNEFKRVAPALQDINNDVSAHDWTELLQLSLPLLGAAWQSAHPQHALIEAEEFSRVAKRVLKPFWKEVVNRRVVVEKPKSAWRKLLGN